MPQVWRFPATSARNAWPPFTAVGTGLAEGPPLEPSWLPALLPQQNAAPLLLSAQVWFSPAASATKRWLVSTGRGTCSTNDMNPAPTSPYRFLPQQYVVAPVVPAHVWWPPTMGASSCTGATEIAAVSA